jgi:hypothetical protein
VPDSSSSAELPTHESADAVLEDVLRRHADALVNFARAEALKDGAPMVLANHARRAERRLQDSTAVSRTRELLSVFGGVLLGAFLSGITTELTKQGPSKVSLGCTSPWASSVSQPWSARFR